MKVCGCEQSFKSPLGSVRQEPPEAPHVPVKHLTAEFDIALTPSVSGGGRVEEAVVSPQRSQRRLMGFSTFILQQQVGKEVSMPPRRPKLRLHNKSEYIGLVLAFFKLELD